MAAIIDNAQPKKEESTSVENTAMTEARARGTIAIGIAKLQPSVKLLIEYAKLWSYYTLIPFKVAQLTLDVLVLSLEITKLCLIAVKANTNLFAQLFQQLLTMTSPEFSEQLVQRFATILQTLVESFFYALQNIVKEFIGALTKIFPSPPFGKLPEFSVPFTKDGEFTGGLKNVFHSSPIGKLPGFSAPVPSTKDGEFTGGLTNVSPSSPIGKFPEFSAPVPSTKDGEFTGGLTKVFSSPPIGEFPGFSAPVPSTKDGMAIPTIADIVPPTVSIDGLIPGKSK